jgi:acetoin:2,6-dichlorophenolindophenol oxidoreductase subunit alpha
MAKYSRDFLIHLYKDMLRIRRCEESLVYPIINRNVKCPVHLCSGEEAVSVGICASLEKEDYVFGNHRSHGHFIAKGGRIDAMIAEIYGKSDGCSKGRGGSMHLVDQSVGMLGSAPIVSGTISLALGAALSSQIRKNKRVTVSFFGDGATNEGVLYECLNFAALKKLPIIFVCENNLYATHMPIDDCRPSNPIASIADPFGILNARIEGNNVIEVYENAKRAVGLCRDGCGPFFIEALTYRLRGHVGPDDNVQGTHTDIRPEKELDAWKKKDPIDSFKKCLLEDLKINEFKLLQIENTVDLEIRKAFLFAQNSPYPNEDELVDFIFKEKG